MKILQRFIPADHPDQSVLSGITRDANGMTNLFYLNGVQITHHQVHINQLNSEFSRLRPGQEVVFYRPTNDPTIHQGDMRNFVWFLCVEDED